MRLVSFRIKNFKSIIDTGECHLSTEDNILVLAGQNEAGKSAVLEALDFFRNGPSEDFERLHRRRDESPQVFCNFHLTQEDIDLIYAETDNEDLRKYLTKNPILSFVRGDTKEDNFDDFYLTTECAETLTKLFPQSQPQEDPPKDEDREEDEYAPIKDLEEYLQKEVRQFVLYEAFKDLLPGVVTIADLSKYPAVHDFEEVFGIDFATIAKRDDRGIARDEQRLNKEASDNLNTYWNQKLEVGSKYNFTVKVEKQAFDEKSTKIHFRIDREDGDPLYMEQKSKGFCWFSAFNLRLRALGVSPETIKSLVLLIDEPGQGLHEKAQQDAKKVMDELAAKGAQIIYTTHHPNLIGTEGKEFSRIRLVSNTRAAGTKVETIAQFSSRAEQGATDALSPIITAMGIHSVGSLLDRNKLNVVVEGISDHYYFTALRKLLSKNERLHFIPSCGVSNIPNLVSVLIGWGCNYKAVFDDEKDSGRKAYNLLKNEFYEKDDKLAHEHILKVKDCTGIEDIFSHEDFFKFVLKEEIPKKGKAQPNSQLASGKKEMLARLFLDSVEKGEVSLDANSNRKIEEIFSWLYDKFDIN